MFLKVLIQLRKENTISKAQRDKRIAIIVPNKVNCYLMLQPIVIKWLSGAID